MPAKKQPPPVIAPPNRRPWLVAEVAVLAIAAALRIWAASDEFWFDEIWSLLNFGLAVQSPGDIFKFHHDNSHHLVTLWMYLVGARHGWMIYRVPSVLASIATVALSAQVARRWGNFAALAASVLSAASFFLITFGSEARGYSLAGCFALVAFLAIDRYANNRSWAWSAVFCLAVILGFLSHLTFLFVYAGAGIWSLVALRRSNQSWQTWLVEIARCHALPFLFVSAFYWFDARHMVVAGGGEPYVTLDVAAETLAYAAGGVGTRAADAAIGLGVLALAIFGLVGLWHEKSNLWIFFAVTIFLAPAAVLAARQPEFLYARYFYVSFVCLLPLVAYSLSRLWSAGRWGPAISATLLGVMVLVNVPRVVEFLRVGRGAHLAALDYMASHAEEPHIDLQTDHDFEFRVEAAFFQQFLSKPLQIGLHPHPIQPGNPPEWLVMFGRGGDFAPPKNVADDLGRTYTLARVFPYAGLSGYHWAVYHRAAASSAGAPPAR